MAAPTRRGNPTARRKRQVRWAKRLRRLGLAWDNALEIARAGRLTAPYGAPFEVIHEERVYKLRRYERTGGEPVAAPLLLVPPLMVASEVYDISPDVSAIAFLASQGIDCWLVDFGAPEHEAGGMSRTLDDHVRAVSQAIDRVRAVTGQDVHLARLLAGRHVRVPGGRVPPLRRARVDRHDGQPGRSASPAPAQRGRHRAPHRRLARGAVVAAVAHRRLARRVHLDRVQAAVGAQGGDAAVRLRAQPARSTSAREARGEAAVPRR